MSEAPIFKKNDLVWAKMKGFSPWPGMVTDPPVDLRRAPKRNVPMQCIFFFGSKNYAWIEEPNIKPYLDYREDLMKTSKSSSFREAVEQIEEYIKDPEKFQLEILPNNTVDSDAEFNKLREKSASIEKTPAKKTTPKAKAKSVSAKSTKSKRESQQLSALSVVAAAVGATAPSTTTTTHSKRKRESTTTPIENRKRYLSNEDYYSPSTSRKSYGATLLNRPPVQRPERAEIDMTTKSDTIKERNISPPDDTIFGFLGLGIMGSAIVKNFLDTGHKVVVWNRTSSKCRAFEEAGAMVGSTPSDVIETADITFCCVSDPQAAKDMVFGNCGVLRASSLATKQKGYVELSTIDPETSQDIAEAIISAGGRYLEAQLQGSKPEADNGTLVILAAGDRTLFNDCQSCFKSIGKNSFFLGDVGNACKVNLILQTIVGVSLVGLSEAMALADRFSISLKDILEIMELTAIKSGLVLEKGKEMLGGEFLPQHPLAHMQKDLRLVLSMAETLDQSMPTTAISNEVFKHAKRLGYSDHDSSAVYVRARF